MPRCVCHSVIAFALFCAAIHFFNSAEFTPSVERYGNVQAFTFVVCGAFLRVIAKNIFCTKPIISFSLSVESDVYDRHYPSLRFP